MTTQKYKVDKILMAKTCKGRLQFLVQWTGFDKPTWEDRRIIEEDAPEAVMDYYKEHEDSLVCQKCGYTATTGDNFAYHARKHNRPAAW